MLGTQDAAVLLLPPNKEKIMSMFRKETRWLQFEPSYFLFEPLCGTFVFDVNALVLLLSEHDLGEDDIYDCVPCDDDGDDIYEDIIKVEVRQPMVRPVY